ncbi:hypothetical protein R3P38DRAFT_3358895 [Favolaschia claudopus]|uniref:Uncharacterized protein n=1 Tax=Favolaschia claudopus TaxID=2862362 RepID=A0AAW0B0F5_9AGAR
MRQAAGSLGVLTATSSGWERRAGRAPRKRQERRAQPLVADCVHALERMWGWRRVATGGRRARVEGNVGQVGAQHRNSVLSLEGVDAAGGGVGCGILRGGEIDGRAGRRRNASGRRCQRRSGSRERAVVAGGVDDAVERASRRRGWCKAEVHEGVVAGRRIVKILRKREKGGRGEERGKVVNVVSWQLIADLLNREQCKVIWEPQTENSTMDISLNGGLVRRMSYHLSGKIKGINCFRNFKIDHIYKIWNTSTFLYYQDTTVSKENALDVPQHVELVDGGSPDRVVVTVVTRR